MVATNVWPRCYSFENPFDHADIADLILICDNLRKSVVNCFAKKAILIPKIARGCKLF